MKKRFVIVVSVLSMLLSMFTGCGEKESGPLRICVDLQIHGIESDMEIDFYDVVGVLQSNEKIGEYELECIPESGSEREAAMDRIRTEMMSGGGPDE